PLCRQVALPTLGSASVLRQRNIAAFQGARARDWTRRCDPADPVDRTTINKRFNLGFVASAMLDPNVLPRPLRDFYELWTRKRGDRRFPARSDYSFEDLQPWLEELHLVEVLPSDFRYKVFATKSARRLGRELTGKLLSECGMTWIADDAG